MNTIIFNSFKNIFSVILVCIASFSSFDINEENINVYNSDSSKNTNITNKITKYKVIRKYNLDMPYGEEKIITEGQNGISYLDSNNKYVVLQKKVDKVIEVGLGKDNLYDGMLTSYGPDCVSCNGLGYVSCPTKHGGNFSLINDGIIYNDETYGDVRVVAADLRAFPCGSIITIINSDFPTGIDTIVLDTGYSMKSAFDNGNIHLDLAFKSQNDINISTNNKTQFKVHRKGW